MPKFRVTTYDQVDDIILDVTDIVEIEVKEGDPTPEASFYENVEVKTMLKAIVHGTFGECVKVVIERVED